jgi:mitogen-activated protein kinase kinase
MASPAPLLRPPIPGANRQQSGSRVPKLGLSIPPSPNARPVNSTAAPPMSLNTSGLPPLSIPPRQQPPKLSLATPMGNVRTPQENNAQAKRKLTLQMPGTGLSANGGGSSDDSAHSRTGSFGHSTNHGGSVSTTSSYSALNFAEMLRNPGDPESAAGSLYSSSSAHSGGAGMERDNSMQGLLPDLEKLSIEKGRPLDVEDLDDAGWKVASKEGRIVELGSLGEGAGGAVTRCILKGGKTVFALKVGDSWFVGPGNTIDHSIADHHHGPKPRREKANCSRTVIQQIMRVDTHLPILWRLYGRHAR